MSFWSGELQTACDEWHLHSIDDRMWLLLIIFCFLKWSPVAGVPFLLSVSGSESSGEIPSWLLVCPICFSCMKSPRIQNTSTQMDKVPHPSVVTCDDQTYLSCWQTNCGMIHGNHSNKNKAVFNLCHTKQKHKDTLHLAYISFRDWLLTFPKQNGGNIEQSN